MQIHFIHRVTQRGLIEWMGNSGYSGPKKLRFKHRIPLQIFNTNIHGGSSHSWCLHLRPTDSLTTPALPILVHGGVGFPKEENHSKIETSPVLTSRLQTKVQFCVMYSRNALSRRFQIVMMSTSPSMFPLLFCRRVQSPST